jgi:DNA-binding transcriptional ArsR family regulator
MLGREEDQDPSLAERVERLEKRVARLEGTPSAMRVGGDTLDTETFWALEGLKERSGEAGAVLFTGTVGLPSGEQYVWQETREGAALLADDWSQYSAVLAALGHPVRLQVLREIVHGVRTVAELGKDERFGTSGQLYHHLRQLVAAGWLRTTARGQYAVPGDRIVPLLAILAASLR